MALLETNCELKSTVIQSWGEQAYHFALKTLSGDVPILSELLDGSIDIDKIDYLARDSHHCGMQFGNGLDVDHLIRSLRCVDGDSRLAIASEGVAAIEGLMIVQDQMLASVYWHG